MGAWTKNCGALFRVDPYSFKADSQHKTRKATAWLLIGPLELDFTSNESGNPCSPRRTNPETTPETCKASSPSGLQKANKNAARRLGVPGGAGMRRSQSPGQEIGRSACLQWFASLVLQALGSLSTLISMAASSCFFRLLEKIQVYIQ